jgi:DNA polymerase V
MIPPTADTALLTKTALTSLRTIYRPGFRYAKAGVMALSLSPAGQGQGELPFGIVPADTNSDLRAGLMATMDKVNSRYGRGSLHVGRTESTTPTKLWAMKQERRTPHYTTDWKSIPLART